MDPALKAFIRREIRQALGNALRLSPVTRASADGEEDGVAGHPTEGAEPKYDYDAIRAEPFGVRSVPTAGDTVEAIWIQIEGGSTKAAIVGTHTKRYGPGDLKQGEVALYNKTAVLIIKLDENGGILIRTHTDQHLKIEASGTGEVQVNTGTLEVARDTDPISAGTLTGQAGPYPVVFTHTDAKTAVVTTAPSVTLTGKITDGASRFKG